MKEDTAYFGHPIHQGKITSPPEEDLSNIAAGRKKSFDLKDR